MSAGNVTFDRPKLERLKAAIAAAQAAGLDQFTFEGHDYMVGYAKYLAEYLEGRL